MLARRLSARLTHLLRHSPAVVVYSGNERFPLNADTDVIGLIELARALQHAR